MAVSFQPLMRLLVVSMLLITLGSAQAQVPPYLPPNGLVAWWSLNGNAADGVGNNHGTVNGASATTDRYGNPNSAYEFDGVDDNITLPNAINFNVNSFTISLYCQVRQWGYTNGSAYIFGSPIEDGNKPHGFRLSHVANRPGLGGAGFEAVIADQAYDDYYVYSNQPVNTGWWYNVTMVYDRQTQTFSLYVNGQLAGQEMVAAGFGMTDRGFSPTIGAYKLQTLVNSYFKGKIDDIAVWNRALTAQEVMMSFRACDFSIISQPTNATVDAGSNATLTVAPTQNSVLYRWQRKVNGTFVEVTDPTDYSGAYTATLTINNVDATLTGTYRCEMTLNNCVVLSDEVQVATTTLTPNIPSYIPQNGLVGWWPFNGNANDESGNGRNFSVNRATLTTGRSGGTDNAYAFDGVNDYLSVSIDQTVAFTISAWIFLNSADRAQGAFQYKYPCIRGGGTAVTASNGKLGSATVDCGECLPYTCNNWSGERTNLANLGSGTWRHVVLTVDGIDKFRLYVDGTLVNTYTNAALISTYQALPFILGKVHDENAFFFDGKIDDAAMWNRALSAAEVKALYNGCDITVTQHPSNASVAQGATKVISVTATSAKTLSYQWQKDAGSGFVNVTNSGSFSGATTATLTISSFSSATAAAYRCVVSTSECSVNSNVAALSISGGSSSWSQVLDSAQAQLANFVFYPTAFDQVNNRVFAINATTNPMSIKIIDLDDASVETFQVSRPIDRIDAHTYDATGNRLVLTRSGRDKVYALNLTAKTWSQIGNGSLDDDSYGSVLYWNKSANGVEFFAGYGYTTAKNWVYRNTGGNWVNIVANQSNCEPRKRPYAWSSLGHPDSNHVFFSSGQGNCSGIQTESTCTGGAAWASDIGKWCWLKDLYRYDITTAKFTNLRPFSDATYVGEGPIAYDYHENKMYQFPQYIPSATWGVAATTFQATSVYAHSVGGSQGYELVQTSGTLPPARTSGTAFYDGTNKRLVLMRTDGMWAMQLGQSDCDISITTQPSSPTVHGGYEAKLSVTATAPSAITYQWQRMIDDAFVDLVDGTEYSGSSSATLEIKMVRVSASGPYRCVLTTADCTLNTDNVTLNVDCPCNMK